MKTPAELAVHVLAELQAAGIRVERQGSNLYLSPAESVPADLLVEARKVKPDLLRLVPEPAPVVCIACKGRDFWRGIVRYTDGTEAPGPWICSRCHPRPKNDALGGPTFSETTKGKKVIAPPQNQKGA